MSCFKKSKENHKFFMILSGGTGRESRMLDASVLVPPPSFAKLVSLVASTCNIDQSKFTVKLHFNFLKNKDSDVIDWLYEHKKQNKDKELTLSVSGVTTPVAQSNETKPNLSFHSLSCALQAPTTNPVGIPLSSLVPPIGIDVRSAARIAIHVLRSLQVASKERKCHCNINPTNIMIQEDTASLIGWHLSCTNEETTRNYEGNTVFASSRLLASFNTPAYTHWDDIESLVYVLLMCLEGKLAWNKDTSEGEILQLRNSVFASKKRGLAHDLYAVITSPNIKVSWDGPNWDRFYGVISAYL